MSLEVEKGGDKKSTLSWILVYLKIKPIFESQKRRQYEI